MNIHNPSTEHLERVRGLFCFLPCTGAFHGQKQAPGPDKWQAVFKQYRQASHRARNRHIERVPPARTDPEFLRAAMLGGHIRQFQRSRNGIEKLHPLVQRIQQDDACVGPGDGHGKTRKARASAHVDQTASLRYQGQDGQGVHKMPHRDPLIIGNGRQIHVLIP